MASIFFKKLLGGDLEDVCYANGDEVFVDRSGYHFEYFLKYLRCYEPCLNQNKDLERLKEELNFYQLHDLVETVERLIKT